MGIYPTENWEQDRKTGLLYHVYNDFSGLKVTTVYQPIIEHHERTDCYCCSCGDREGSDPACRNHGYYGTRPCELHGTSGSPWEDTGEMPLSVQEQRRLDRAATD